MCIMCIGDLCNQTEKRRGGKRGGQRREEGMKQEGRIRRIKEEWKVGDCVIRERKEIEVGVDRQADQETETEYGPD